MSLGTTGFNSLDLSSQDVLNIVQRTITSSLDLYVATTGSDSNDGSATSPFATIQKALDSLKDYYIAQPVVINVGSGSFAGFKILDYNFSVPSGSITVSGALQTANVTGTTNSQSAATGFTVITDNTKSFTTNEHQGKYLLVKTGSQFTVGQIYQIFANSSNTITLSTNTVNAITTYEILDHATEINTVAPAFPGVNAGISITDTSRGQALSTQINIRNLKVNLTSNTAFYSRGDGYCQFNYCTFLTTTGIPVFINGFGLISFVGCHIKSSASSLISNTVAGSSPSFNFGSCLINNTGTGTSFNTTSLNSSTVLTFSWLTGSAYTTGISATTAKMAIGNTRVAGATTAISAASSDMIFGSGGANNLIIENCTTAISATAGSRIRWGAGNMIISNCTTGISATTGTKIVVPSTATFTSVTTELSVDGSTSTVAAMRALTPKAFPASPNVYGTVVYE